MLWRGVGLQSALDKTLKTFECIEPYAISKENVEKFAQVCGY